MTRTATSRLRDFFVAPARAAPVEHAAAVPPVVVVLGDARGAPATACAAALELARAAGHGHAGVCVWPPTTTPTPRAPATRAARRAAARATARGLDAHPSGRLVRVRLPTAPNEAVAAAQRTVAALDCPTTCALAGPRTDELDTLLALADAILLLRRPTDPPALTRLAEAGLSDLGVPVLACDPVSSPFAVLLATAGIGVALHAGAALSPLTATASSGLAAPD